MPVGGAHATRHWLDRRVLLGAVAVLAVAAGASFAAMSDSGSPAARPSANRTSPPSQPPSSAAATPITVPSTPASQSSSTPSPSRAPAPPARTSPPTQPVRSGTQGQRMKLLKLVNAQRLGND